MTHSKASKTNTSCKCASPSEFGTAAFQVTASSYLWRLGKNIRNEAASSIHEYFSKWAQAGLFIRLWQEGLLSYDELRGIGWEWQSTDGCMVKAPLSRETTGRNPTDRKKKSGSTSRTRSLRRSGGWWRFVIRG